MTFLLSSTFFYKTQFVNAYQEGYFNFVNYYTQLLYSYQKHWNLSFSLRSNHINYIQGDLYTILRGVWVCVSTYVSFCLRIWEETFKNT